MTRFWRFFPFSDHGVYNLNEENIISATPRVYILYGFEINKANSDPESCVTYTDMAVGFTPARVNLSTGAFDPGSWTEDVFFRQNNHVWMVKSDGTPDYQLNDNDYTKKLDGSASDVSNSAYDGNAMVRFDTVWIKASYITQDEYENLHDYLYEPYLALGGNGTAKKVMAEVERLPLNKNKEE